MRALFTGDLQAEWAVLDECSSCWDEILDICAKHRLQFIVICGDLKRNYNPVDVRVIKWWLKAIEKARRKDLRVIIINGNHDRVGMHSDAKNWLPILQKAGAETYDHPDTIYTPGGSLFLLPFNSSVKQLRKQARKLAAKAHKNDILVFHADIQGSKFNQLGEKSNAIFGPEELNPGSYRACIGGHIHLHQKIGKNIWYTGSPFATDWGEANQRKGYIVVTGSTGTNDIRFVPTRLPGWYDESWPGFTKPRSWHGTHVRIHVDCESTSNYEKHLEKCRISAEHKYPGAILHIVPEFPKQLAAVETIETGTDEGKIRSYVRKSIPTALSGREQQIAAYLNYRLRQVGGIGLRTGTNLEFLYAKGKNFLSFEKTYCDYRQQGVVVVQGNNTDTGGGRSNGSGKTNYLQLIPVAGFGTTFKGQKHDKWANRHRATESAYVKLVFRDAKKRKITIDRRRRPGKLRLTIDGNDESSGMRANAKDGTQGQIEKVMGFTRETLANAVYIDESLSKAFLNPNAQKARMDLLNRFQNLERFEQALKLVKADKSRHTGLLAEAEVWHESLKSRIADCRKSLERAERTFTGQLKEVKFKWQAAQTSADTHHKKYKIGKAETDEDRKRLKKKIEVLHEKESAQQRKLYALEHRKREIEDWLLCGNNLHKNAICPTCGQKLDHKHLQKEIKKHQKELADILGKITILKQRSEDSKQADLLEGKYDALGIRLQQIKQNWENCEHEALYFGEQYSKLKSKTSAEKQNVLHYRQKLRKLKWRVLVTKRYLKTLESDTSRYDYCEQAFSREGIPAYLNALLVPTLDKAAAYYSKLFFENAVIVKFDAIENEIIPRVINATGGEDLEAQSKGERAMAGLITSFAVREIAPVCNLLILDEPGDGLDPVNARQFARALSQLKKKFGTILLTTYNPDILSELAEERSITIRKEHGGISRVTESK